MRKAAPCSTHDRALAHRLRVDLPAALRALRRVLPRLLACVHHGGPPARVEARSAAMRAAAAAARRGAGTRRCRRGVQAMRVLSLRSDRFRTLTRDASLLWLRRGGVVTKMDAMNDAAASMRVLGILTGITHVSGADYLQRSTACKRACQRRASDGEELPLRSRASTATRSSRLRPATRTRARGTRRRRRRPARRGGRGGARDRVEHGPCAAGSRACTRTCPLHIADAVAPRAARAGSAVGLLGTRTRWPRGRVRDGCATRRGVVCPADARARASASASSATSSRARAPRARARLRAARALRASSRRRRARRAASAPAGAAARRRGARLRRARLHRARAARAAGRLPRRRAAQLGAAPRRGGRARRAPRADVADFAPRRAPRRAARPREADAAPAPRSWERHGTVGPVHACATPGKQHAVDST